MTRMTTFREYVQYGVNEDSFRDMLNLSVESLKDHKRLSVNASVEECRENLVYIGVPNMSFIENDGSPFGKHIKMAGEPVILYRQRATPDTMGYVFRQLDNDNLWYTGNGNSTISPWDAKILLNQCVGITTDTIVRKQGNSLVIILTDEIRLIGADVGDELKVTITRN